MSDTVIKVEGLSKLYRIGSRQGDYRTLRDTIAQSFQTSVSLFRNLSSYIFHRPSHFSNRPSSISHHPSAVENGTIWALKDVSFEIKRGEVVGIIGRNGAGKSTLLKILSRITEPTEGYAKIHGRVGSLLEVGTGFHPELTGRENIYLNGAILGMKKTEIQRKFDEIVAFAEVEKFIDTPVKHYSSGMYVRLAFAVAAHLEPEILLVDEVLAVGDVGFQKKCLGKMGDVAREGRTVLFVSHNMQAVKSLCKGVFQLEGGQLIRKGYPESVVAAYLRASNETRSEVVFSSEEAPGNDELKLTGIRVFSEGTNACGIFSSDRNLYLEIQFTANTNHSALCVGFDLVIPEGTTVLRSYQTDLPHDKWPLINVGENRWTCTIPAGFLNAGVYYVSPRIGRHNMYWIVKIDAAVQFEIVLDHGVSPLWNSLGGRNRPGVVAPILNWETNSSDRTTHYAHSEPSGKNAQSST